VHVLTSVGIRGLEHVERPADKHLERTWSSFDTRIITRIKIFVNFQRFYAFNSSRRICDAYHPFFAIFSVTSLGIMGRKLGNIYLAEVPGAGG
jgi:hypothetical protein